MPKPVTPPAPSTTPIADAWESLYQAALAHHVARESIQYIETRRAFYAGASTVFFLVTGIGSDHITEDQGVQIIEDVTAEVTAFSHELKRAAAAKAGT